MSKKELSKEELSEEEDQDQDQDQDQDHDSTSSDSLDNEDDIGDGDGDADPDELEDEGDELDELDELDQEKETDIEISEVVDDDDKCVHKHTKKNNSDSEDDKRDDDQEEEIIAELEEIFDDDNKNTSLTYVPDNMRITKPIMTKYERVRILGDRTRQLLGGAKPMIKGVRNIPAKDIAVLELKHNLIPLKIERPLPNGKMEIWKISELKH